MARELRSGDPRKRAKVSEHPGVKTFPGQTVVRKTARDAHERGQRRDVDPTRARFRHEVGYDQADQRTKAVETLLIVAMGIIGEPLAAKILVKHYNAPAVRVPCGAKVADLFFIYPDNLDPVKVKDAPETISLIGNGAGYIDNITFVGAFVGIGTPKGGANCGQTVIRHVNGFVHDTVVHIDGSLDIVRIENVHSFVAGGPNDEKGYYRTHRKCFHMGATDGLMISKSFMIFGKIFLLKENGNHGAGLSSYLSQCWVEGCSDYGIQVNDGSRISIDGLEITCAYSKALIELNKGAYGRIHSCYMRDSFNSTGVVINEGSGAIITNCEMHGTPGFTGIRVNTKERSIISHNFIHHAEVGIACSKDADGYLISENQISGNNQPLNTQLAEQLAALKAKLR